MYMEGVYRKTHDKNAVFTQERELSVRHVEQVAIHDKQKLSTATTQICCLINELLRPREENITINAGYRPHKEVIRLK